MRRGRSCVFIMCDVRVDASFGSRLFVYTVVTMPRIDIRTQTQELNRTVREQTVGYVVAALSLVAGLAWNDAIKALITFFFPLDDANSILAKFVYAGLMTLVVVLLTMIVKRTLLADEKKDEKS